MKLSQYYLDILLDIFLFFFLKIRQPPRSTLDLSSAASDVYKRQDLRTPMAHVDEHTDCCGFIGVVRGAQKRLDTGLGH